MKVQGIDYGPELKIKNDTVRRLANQRALLGDALKVLQDKRFILNEKILSLESKQFQVQETLHQTQREIFEIHDLARKEDDIPLSRRISRWIAEGKTDQEITLLMKRYT